MAVAIYTTLLTLNEAPSGEVEVQDAGTSSQRLIYTDTALSTLATNPIELDSAGRSSQGILYTAAGAYKVIVRNSAGSQLYVRDNIDPGVPLGSGVLAIANGGTGGATASAARAALGAVATSDIEDLETQVAQLAGAAASTEGTQVATGSTAQRPGTPAEGQIRRNTSTSKWEGYDGTDWDNFINDDDVAAQSDQETGTSTTTFVSPGRQHFHKSALKAWANITITAGVPAVTEGYNVASVSDNGTGDFTVNFTTPLSNATYAAVASVRNVNSGEARSICIRSKAVGGVRVNTFSGAGSLSDDVAGFDITVMGDI